MAKLSKLEEFEAEKKANKEEMLELRSKHNLLIPLIEKRDLLVKHVDVLNKAIKLAEEDPETFNLVAFARNLVNTENMF